MARTDTLDHFLTDVADALRSKTGTQALIDADDFDTEIANLPSGTDWSVIGYQSTPQSVQDVISKGLPVLQNFTPTLYSNWYYIVNRTGDTGCSVNDYLQVMPKLPLEDYWPLNGSMLFARNSSLIEVPAMAWENISTNGHYDSTFGAAYGMFQECSALQYLPNLNMTNADGPCSYMFSYCTCLKEVHMTLPKMTALNYAFQGCKRMKTIELLNCEKLLQAQSMCSNCDELETFTMTNAPLLWKMDSIFSNCKALTITPNLPDNESATYSSAFYGCYALTESTLVLNNATNVNSMFASCTHLTTLPATLGLSKATDMNYLFYQCAALVSVPEFDCSSCVVFNNVFGGCYALTNLGGFKDLGKAYLTNARANFTNYRVYLGNELNNLTKQSVLNVINDVYDIATKGCNVQQIYVPSSIYSQLTAAEIQIAADKGWTVVSS